MKYKFIISRLAGKDVKQSFEWYEERSKQSADNFTIEIENTIKKFATIPKLVKTSMKIVMRLN